MTNEHFPEEWSLGGEIASSDDIAFMEGLASDLLSTFPGEIHQRYGYSTEQGSICFFSTIEYEEYPDNPIQSVMICDGFLDNLKFEIVIRNKTECDTYLANDDELGGLTYTLQDLLENGNLQSDDATILRHIQSIVFCLMNSSVPEYIELLPELDPNKDFRYLSDVISEQVQKNTSLSLKSKSWDLAFDDGTSLEITSNIICGESIEDDDLSELPILEIEYCEPESKTILNYRRLLDGEVVLETSVINEGCESEMSEVILDDDLEDQISDFITEMGIDIPRAHDVRLIIKKLSQAILAEIESSN